MARIIIDQTDFADGLRTRYDGSNFVDWVATSAGHLSITPSGGNVGIGTTGPLKPVHVQISGTGVGGLTANHLGAATETIPYVFVGESTDAVMALASTNEGSHSSGIDLLEVNSGTLVDRWTLVRRTSDAGTDESALVFHYGTDAYYPNNHEWVTISPDVTFGAALWFESHNMDQSWRDSGRQWFGAVGNETTLFACAKDTGTWGAFLSLGQWDDSNVVGSQFENAWGIGRQTNGDGGGDGRLVFSYGTSTDPATNSTALLLTTDGALGLVDGITAPTAATGFAFLYVDTADGDLKVRFGDGTTKTIATDT